MSITNTTNVDCVIIGSSISSSLLSILLGKKNYPVLLFNNSNLNKSISEEHYSLIPLSFFKLHSIPYSELSIKNKSYDSYIERFITFEKFFLQTNSDNDNDFYLFYTFRQFGVVNQLLFKKFLNTLMKKEKNLKEEAIDESFKISKKNNDEQNFVYNIQTASQQIELPSNKIIITDKAFRDHLNQKFATTKVPIFKYQLKIHELLSDSINHYLMTNNRVIKKITVIPCSKFSIVEFFAVEELMDPFHNEITRFLQDKYEISTAELEFQFKELYFLTVTSEAPDYLNIVPTNVFFSYPIQSKLFNEMQSAFYLSLAMDDETDIKYNDWLYKTLNKFNLLNEVFLGKNDVDLKTPLAKLIKNKDIGHINKISKLFLNMRFKSYFKEKDFTIDEFEIIIKILSYSEII